jgi:hypothetical protein
MDPLVSGGQLSIFLLIFLLILAATDCRVKWRRYIFEQYESRPLCLTLPGHHSSTAFLKEIASPPNSWYSLGILVP